MDVSGIISRFATGSFTVTQRARAGAVHGKVTPGPVTTLVISGSVWPASGEDLMRLPEGRRTTETRWLMSTSRLHLGGPGEAFEADLIVIDGQTFEVQRVDVWRDPVSQVVGYRHMVQAA